MDLHARLRAALDSMPPGSLVPRDWLLAVIEECGGNGRIDLTAEEFGAHVGRAPSTIRTWAAAGRLPGAYRLQGREWRIPREALKALREESMTPESHSGSGDLRAWRNVQGGGQK